MKLGDYVQTHKFGWGTVVGFEILGVRKAWVSSQYEYGARVILALDNPALWVMATDKQPHPYMMQSDFVQRELPASEPQATSAPTPTPDPLPDLPEPEDAKADVMYAIAIALFIAAILMWVTRDALA